MNPKTVFVPNLPLPNSFDPLDADMERNLWVMRMINLTPLEVSPENKLTSHLLEEFGYDQIERKITFSMRRGLKYSNGQPITADDLAFAIARMAHARPKFPTLSSIDGIEEWAARPDALFSLPPGIKVTDSVVEIRFSKPVLQPLFRFTLELFSVVPKSSFDLKTNKLKNERPPTSGYYEISDSNESRIRFVKRVSTKLAHGIDGKSEITFVYLSQDSSVGTQMGDNEFIMLGNGLPVKTENSETLRARFQELRQAPAANFGALVINPNFIKDASCRQMFANKFRLALAQNLSLGVQTEASLFTKILPGFLPIDELAKFDSSQDCHFQSESHQPIPWFEFADGFNPFFNGAIRSVARSMGIKLELRGARASLQEQSAEFYKNNSAFFFIRSGFWPLDPIGDIQMFFTPNMHESLEVIWSDGKVRQMLDGLKHLGDTDDPNPILKELNIYLYKNAIFNPIVHFGRYYASSRKGLLRDLPMAVQQPYAWQAFNED